MRDLEQECWERYKAAEDDVSRREWIALVLKIRCAGPKGKGDGGSTDERPGGRHSATAGVLKTLNGSKG